MMTQENDPFAQIKADARARLAATEQAKPNAEDIALSRIGKERASMRREAARVQNLIDRDNRDREMDRRRKQARIDVEDGHYSLMELAKDGPTPEQLSKGEFIPVEVDNPIDTVRDPISTVRRQSSILRLYRAGIFDQDMFHAAHWYRTRYELSGLDPLVASTFDPRYGSGQPIFGHMAKTPIQVEARQDFRWAQGFIAEDVRGLFDAVVIREMAIRDAAKEVQLRYANASAALRRAALCLYEGVRRDIGPMAKKFC